MNGRDTELATLAGGCFWCLEAVFEQLQGVELVESGYTGGHVPNPSYQAVCTGSTGHAEAVQVTFYPGVLTFSELLEIFFAIHDPTTLNRQGGDVGTQYRSSVFYHSPTQKEAVEKVIADLETDGAWGQPIVTEVAPIAEWHPAEEYHQRYYQQNGGQPYCQMVISPKVAKFRKQFAAKLKAGATTVDA
jgi:peptide-methionine (S)-S-oxide reductase